MSSNSLPSLAPIPICRGWANQLQYQNWSMRIFSFLHRQKQNITAEILSEYAYLKPLNIVHPFYYPDILNRCPRCGSTGRKIEWNGWTSTGHREVHGISQEETAIGVQLRCSQCEKQVRKVALWDSISYCFVMTSHLFWDNVEHWDMPSKYFTAQSWQYGLPEIAPIS